MKRLMSLLLCAGLVVAGPLAAQEEVEIGAGATLRALDKVDGSVRDIKMRNASSARFGRLTINLGECRYPAGNPAGDAFAYLTVHPEKDVQPIFSGWMIASSPALNAMEHPRYDIWVLRCTTG